MPEVAFALQIVDQPDFLDGALQIKGNPDRVQTFRSGQEKMVLPLADARALPDRCAGALVPPMLRALVPRHLADRRPRLPRLPGVAVSQGAFGEVARLASFPYLIPTLMADRTKESARNHKTVLPEKPTMPAMPHMV